MEFIWLDQTRLPSCTELASGLFAFLVKTLLASRWVKPGKNPLGITKGRGEGRVRDMMHQVSAPPVTSPNLTSPLHLSQTVNVISLRSIELQALSWQLKDFVYRLNKAVPSKLIEYSQSGETNALCGITGELERARERRSLVVGWWSHNVRMG